MGVLWRACHKSVRDGFLTRRKGLVSLLAWKDGNERQMPFCFMPNHWYLALLPQQDGKLSQMTGWWVLIHR